MTPLLGLVVFLAVAGILLYHRLRLWLSTVILFLLLLVHAYTNRQAGITNAFEIGLFFIIAICLNYRWLRRRIFTDKILNIYRQKMPRISTTEREAIEAGTVGWERDVMTGMPDWQKLHAIPAAQLTPEEKAFLDGPVEEACRMANDWDITHKRADLSPELWQYLKIQGFFGMIIPKTYGGKEFSPAAHSAVLIKLFSRSMTLAITVGVPNSLGPAELLLHYGTNEQKDYYLPRLAKGEEIPCFALTNPEAGSDASSIPDYGIVCRGQFENKEIIGIRLNWDKRYITLAPVATVIGLAFKLYDPDHLLGQQEELGITCALIPASTPGITIGRRHYPLNAAFQNGPTQGKDVFIPIDWVIGGANKIGQGWRMLMECLAAGRAITLPSSAAGGSKCVTFMTGAYAQIRKQFNRSIGKFEGIEEPLARIAAYTYLIDASLKFTLAVIMKGEKPAIAAAILKSHSTELARKIINDAMDIHGGKSICLGPRNYLGRDYQTTPISITVEGANILSRCLIIFGQGVLRCHPYLLTEMQSAMQNNKAGDAQFDRALWRHIGFVLSNLVRTFWLGLTGGRTTNAPTGPAKRYYQQITRFSSVLALLSDVAILTLGADLKKRENISARLSDILSYLYLESALLKHYADQGELNDDWPFIAWISNDLFFTIQNKISELLHNFPLPGLGCFLHRWIFPWGMHFKKPKDVLSHQISKLVMKPSTTRARLCKGIFEAPISDNLISQMDYTLEQTLAVEDFEKVLLQAEREGKIKGRTFAERIQSAIENQVLTQEEAQKLLVAYKARWEIIKVDDFAPEEIA